MGRRAYCAPHKHVWRAEMVLLSATGAGANKIMGRTASRDPRVALAGARMLWRSHGPIRLPESQWQPLALLLFSPVCSGPASNVVT